MLRGETRYLDDLEPAGTVHVAFVRSPYAHARITAVEVPAAADGLVAVVTGADLRGQVQAFPLMRPEGAEVLESEAHPVLAAEEVRYAGQAVAMVIAQTRAVAEDAVELVEVDYEPLQPVTVPRASDLVSMSWERRTGDVDAAFAAAAHVVSGSYALPRLAAAPMETRGCVASYDPGHDALTVWLSAQDTHRPMAQLAHILGPSGGVAAGDRARRRRGVREQGGDRARGRGRGGRRDPSAAPGQVGRGPAGELRRRLSGTGHRG